MGARRASVSAVSSSTLTTCWDCSSTTNLWICLICGNIGCGRYGRAHAQSHYEATTHLYALELETQRVWDYAGDGYVHRLIQNKADGKLVELPSAASMSSSQPDGQRNLGPGPSDNLTAEKIEAIGIEYSYLLTSQLDSQREYFEKDRMALKTQLDEIRRELESVKETNEQHSTRFAKEQAKLEKRAEKTTELARRLEKDLKEERAVSSGLMQNMTALKAKLELCENDKKADLAKIQDLEEQIRDLMFFVEAKDKIAQGGGAFEEAAGGSLQVAQTSKRKGKKS
jgi:BRCA1-associated protein